MSSSEVEVEVEEEEVSPPAASERDDRAFAAAPPTTAPIADGVAGFSGSHPVQSLTASWPAALAGLFENQVTLFFDWCVQFQNGKKEGEDGDLLFRFGWPSNRKRKSIKKKKINLTSSTPRAASAA